MLFACSLLSCAQKNNIGIDEVRFLAKDNQALTTNLSGHPDDDKIFIRAPYGLNLDTLTPSISFHGQNISPLNGIAENYTSPVQYTVTDNINKKSYTVVIQPDDRPNLFPVAGDGLPGITSDEKIMLPGGNGVIRLTTPVNYRTSAKKYPLLLHVPGAGGDAVGSEKKFPFSKVTGTPNFEFFAATWDSGVIDLKSTLFYLTSNFPIDTNHIWLFGHSTGAWTVSEGACELENTPYTIELIIVAGTPYTKSCPAGKHHFILSGSLDFVPFFDTLTSRFLFSRYKSSLHCKSETISHLKFEGSPYPTRRYIASGCDDNKELHLYILEGAMHNSFYSKNFILNVIREAFNLAEGKVRKIHKHVSAK